MEKQIGAKYFNNLFDSGQDDGQKVKIRILGTHSTESFQREPN